jgi:serine/threonine protein kinase
MNARVERLFHEVADLSAEARTQYFAENGVDEETRREVEALLSFDARASVFLERDVSAAAGWALTQIEARGRHCGPFRLLDVVGRGGMGAVYLAERADGEVTQRVAVKLLPLGAGAPQRARFLQERQILAALAHPNIARMLDAGHLDNGQPFLVMEYVNGKPIDVFAAEFSMRQKIALFLKVCAAVAYSHRNLVVHRDLKPSNILVTVDGEPKLLDFGIAKILDLTADLTITSMRMLTPDYASPEQVMGGRASTATDIYSLGAVLYRLLTGKPPHEFEDHSPEAIASVIMTREVTRPSTLAPELKGDIEVILLKALRKDAQERYATVEQFAEDLEAFLKSRPVRARSGNTWYRTRKFLRRYWMSVAPAAVAFGGLAIGLAVALRERDLAEKRFRDVRQIASELFNVERDINSLSGATAARERIVRTALEYLERLSKDAGNNLELKNEIAGGYRKVADVQGVFRGTNLGHPDQARVTLQKAEALFRENWKARDNDRQALQGLIETVDLQSRVAFSDKNLKQLESKIVELEVLLPEYVRHGSNDVPEFGFLATIYDSMAIALADLNRLDQAVGFARLSIDYRRKVVQQDRSVAARGSLANSLATYARNCRLSGNLEEAVRAFRESIALLEEDAAEEPDNYKVRLNIANNYIGLGRTLGDKNSPSLGRTQEAVQYFEHGLRIGRRVMASDPKETMIRYNHSIGAWRLGDALRNQDATRSLASYDEAIGLLRGMTAKSFSRDVPLVIVLAESTFPLRRLRREIEARQRLQQARQIAEVYRNVAWPASALCNEAISRAEADWALAAGRPLDAVAQHRAWLDLGESGKPSVADQAANDLSSAFMLIRRYRLLADTLRAAGQETQAAQADSERRKIVESWKKKLAGNQSVEAILLR